MASGSGEPDPAAEDEEQLGDFLLNTERLYDCYFVVGNSEQGAAEKIGAVKACLMNQSKVFRNMLHDSTLKETGDIKVPDIEPSIFRLLLKHCYGGLDSCRPLSLEITVQLCYAAEKYMIDSLKKKIAERLRPDCAPEVFPALFCLVTYNVNDLAPIVSEIIREQTKQIFSSQSFVDIDVNSLEFIVKQEVLSCSEIEVWRAVVKWATNKAQSVEGTSMRDLMAKPLKHVRLMTLTSEDLCKEVLSANVLTFEEFTQVCTKNGQSSDTVCTLTEKRGVFQERWKCWETVIVNHDAKEGRWTKSDESHSCLVVGDHNIMLESVTCLGSIDQNFTDCYGLTYPCKVEITLSRITDYISSTSTDEPIVIRFNGTASYFEQFTIPTLLNGDGITLRANSTYKLKITFVGTEKMYHPCWHAPSCSDGHVFTHGKFYCSYIYEDGIGWKPTHIVKFQYSYRR